MINKIFWVEGAYGHYSCRVKASDIIPLIPELVRSGRMRDIYSRNRYRDYKSTGHHIIRLFMDRYEIHSWLQKKGISIMREGYSYVDNSMIFENEPEYIGNNQSSVAPEQVIYL